ncbi:DNA polymerase III subunit gamma/tau [Microbacterium koreense]|uniref:DNA polymerase III subunit gamma/tau n=1 Tax=Microbacterium koreense TaxID=323761 RepID=A0ABW2ZRR4_9MICO
MKDRDDDALSWGDDDPTMDVAGSESRALPEGYTAVGKGSEALARSEDAASIDDGARAEVESTGTEDAPDEDSEPAAQMGNGMLIALGIFAGVYLLFCVGWLIGGLRLQTAALFVVSPEAYQPALVLAVAAPLIWFGTTLFVTRGRAAWLRIVWLVGGVVLLVPWPFIMVGAVGQ